MTNEQLKILLQAYAARLHAEIEKLRDQLPDECERHQEYWHKETDARAEDNPWYYYLPTRLEKDDRYELRKTGDFVILDGLQKFWRQLTIAIKEL